MSELKTAVLREILFAHASRSVTNTLYEQIIVRGKLDDKLADIGPRISAILGCDDPSTDNEELLAAVMAKMETTMQLGFDRTEQKMVECKDEIKDEVKSGVATVCEKVSRLKCRGKRRSKYDEAVVSFCVACVEAAKGKEILRNSKNGKQNLEDVFVYYRAELERKGVADFATFKRIIHAYRASESRARIKELVAKQSAAENGIIRGMAKTTRGTAAE